LDDDGVVGAVVVDVVLDKSKVHHRELDQNDHAL
jgi:hypothetical protein